MIEGSLSVVIPAFNAAATIGRAIESVVSGWPSQRPGLEIVVVDDGSADPDALLAATEHEPRIRLVHHGVNRGMCAARNTGIGESRGAVVTILDADDNLVDGWTVAFDALLSEWPEDCSVAFAACVTPTGEPTVAAPLHRGPMSFEDFVAERFAGEYLPLFRGSYVRERRYVDLGTRKSCGLLSYLRFLEDGPIWVSPLVLRVYDHGQQGSVTSGWARPERAAESVKCLEAVLQEYGPRYAAVDRRRLGGLWSRLAVYRRLAGVPGAWTAWAHGARSATPIEILGAFVMMVLGPGASRRLVRWGKRFRMVKRFG